MTKCMGGWGWVWSICDGAWGKSRQRPVRGEEAYQLEVRGAK